MLNMPQNISKIRRIIKENKKLERELEFYKMKLEKLIRKQNCYRNVKFHHHQKLLLVLKSQQHLKPGKH